MSPGGFTTLVIAHVMFCDLGAGPVTTFRTITLPLLAPGVVAGALLAFVLSIDDFVISNSNSGTTLTFPLYIFGARP